MIINGTTRLVTENGNTTPILHSIPVRIASDLLAQSRNTIVEHFLTDDDGRVPTFITQTIGARVVLR